MIRFSIYRLSDPSRRSRPLQWPQHLDRLTISEGWGLCLVGVGNGKTAQEMAWWGHQAWTEKRQQNFPSYLEVSRQALPNERDRNPPTPSLHCPVPAPVSSSPLSCSHTESSASSQEGHFPKVRLRTGTWGSFRFLTLTLDLPFPLLQEGEESNIQRETESWG